MSTNLPDQSQNKPALMPGQSGLSRRKNAQGNRSQMFALVVGLVLITFLIYYAESLQFDFFATLRYLYLIPIAYVALKHGRHYGIGISLLITSLFIPIFVLVLIKEGPLAVNTIELGITLLLFNAIAFFGGELSKREVLQKERYRMLNHLSEQFGRELDLAGLSRVILNGSVQALNVESGELLLQDDLGTLRLIAQAGNVPQSLPPEQSPDKNSNYCEIAEWIYGLDQIIHLEHPGADPRFDVLNTQPPINSLIAAPLRRHGEPFGVLALYNRRSGAFSARDVDLVAEIAIKSETALENAQLYQTLEERVQQRTQDLLTERNKLDVVLRNMADALVVTDTNGCVILLNPVFARLVGQTESKILNCSLARMLSSPTLASLVAQAVKQPFQVHTADVTLASGWVYGATACAIKPNGEVTGVVIVLRDITQEVEVDRMKTEFISTVSHELRTPLTSVLGFAKLISRTLEKNLTPKIAPDDHRGQRAVQRINENLNIIVDEGERLTRLINDVLDIAKMEAGKVEWNMTDVTVERVIRNAAAAASALLKANNLAIIVDVQPGLPSVWADADRLFQVMTNLLSNAIKFTEQGEIHIHCHDFHGEIDTLIQGLPATDVTRPFIQSMTEWLVVSVRDTGIGIAREQLPKVFERFRQVGDAMTDRPRGTGLGLPICKEIIEHHKGVIWVQSALESGSTFTFVLPLTQPDWLPDPPDDVSHPVASQLALPDLQPTRTKRTQPCILVVDDEANIRNLLSQTLSQAGYQVIQASDGEQALTQAWQEHPDLIILDVMMPGISGFDVTGRLRADPTMVSIPILILSIVEDRQQSARLGVEGYLTKPLDIEKLLQSVSNLLNRDKLNAPSNPDQ